MQMTLLFVNQVQFFYVPISNHDNRQRVVGTQPNEQLARR